MNIEFSYVYKFLYPVGNFQEQKFLENNYNMHRT